MPARPVAQAVTLSTSTGAFGPVYFGEPRRYAQVSYLNASTRSVAGTVQGSVGHAAAWKTIITLTTANSTGTVNLMSTGGALFDKLRVNVTGNETTAASVLWLSAY